MSTPSIYLACNAAYGQTGHHIARITGRNSKMTFEREFLAKQLEIDTPGLYEVRNVDRKARKEDDHYLVVETAPGSDRYVKILIDKESAMKIAKELDAGRAFAEAVALVEPDAEAVALEAEKKIATPEHKAEIEARLSALEAESRWPDHSYRLVTAKEAAAAKATAVTGSAEEQCWAVLSRLPAKEAKKVLAALKARLTPPAAE